MRVAIEDCGVWRFTVDCVKPGSVGWQQVYEGCVSIGIPPIEYTIKSGDEIEVWLRRMTVPWSIREILNTEGLFFRINRIGSPIPYPDNERLRTQA